MTFSLKNNVNRNRALVSAYALRKVHIVFSGIYHVNPWIPYLDRNYGSEKSLYYVYFML